MALILPKELPDGEEVSYWRLVQTNFSWLDGNVRLEIAGYKDAAARNIGKRSATVITRDYTGDDFQAFQDWAASHSGPTPLYMLYNLLKNDPYFQGATDG